MKCIKNGDEIKRVSDVDAMVKVGQGWAYCKKSEWKKKGKPQEKVVEVVAANTDEVVEKKAKKHKKTPYKKEDMEAKKEAKKAAKKEGK